MSKLSLDGIQEDIWNLHHLLDTLRDHIMEVCADHKANALVKIARDASRTICSDVDAAVDTLVKARAPAET